GQPTPLPVLRRSAGQEWRESGIYGDLPPLRSLNSHPINADSYLIGWRGVLSSIGKGVWRMWPAASSGSNLAEQPSARRRGSATLSVVLAGAIVLLALAGGLAQSLLPGTLVGRDAPSVVAAVIFPASYLALAVGRIPGLVIDRAGVALVGACLMVAGGALPLEDAYKAVDLDTLTLLLGMMIVGANLRLSGYFAQASAWVMRRAHHPLALLAAVTTVAGVFSAFLVNDAICLVLAPPVLQLTLSLGATRCRTCSPSRWHQTSVRPQPSPATRKT